MYQSDTDGFGAQDWKVAVPDELLDQAKLLFTYNQDYETLQPIMS